MESIPITNARQDLYKLAVKTIETSEPIRITSKNGDVVIMSAEDYSSLQETVYLLSIPGMRESLVNAAQEPIELCATLEDIGWDIK